MKKGFCSIVFIFLFLSASELIAQSTEGLMGILERSTPNDIKKAKMESNSAEIDRILSNLTAARNKPNRFMSEENQMMSDTAKQNGSIELIEENSLNKIKTLTEENDRLQCSSSTVPLAVGGGTNTALNKTNHPIGGEFQVVTTPQYGQFNWKFPARIDLRNIYYTLDDTSYKLKASQVFSTDPGTGVTVSPAYKKLNSDNFTINGNLGATYSSFTDKRNVSKGIAQGQAGVTLNGKAKWDRLPLVDSASAVLSVSGSFGFLLADKSGYASFFGKSYDPSPKAEMSLVVPLGSIFGFSFDAKYAKGAKPNYIPGLTFITAVGS